MADDENCEAISAKRIKLSPSMDDLQSEESKEGKTEFSNINVVLPDPNSQRSPEESVFSIDHILESIFLKCDLQTLKKCRLVSRRWAYYGSKELQKTVQIGFIEPLFHSNAPKYFHMGSNGTRFMEDLITLMNNSMEFPANSFRLTRIHQHEIQLGTQSFFDAHGALIKKITFGGYLCLDDLKQLVLSKAPNLEQLSLDYATIGYKNYANNFVGPETHVHQLERCRLERSLYDENFLGPKPILRTLKVFNCSCIGVCSEIFIRQILECSPNLVEVVLPGYCLHLLIKPTNRLHLLKKLTLRIDNNNIESVEAVANQNEGNWAVRELQYLSYINHQSFHGGDNTEFISRVTCIMNNIYKNNSATCQKLHLSRHLENVKIPQMPQVKRLSFLYSENEETGLPFKFLPEGDSLQDVFPNLIWLKIIPTRMDNLRTIEDVFGYDDPAPVPSVKKVILRFFKLHKRLRKSFKTMFPNATIHNRFSINPDDDGSDEGEREDEEDDNDSESDVDESDVGGSDVDGSEVEVDGSDVDGSDVDGNDADEIPVV